MPGSRREKLLLHDIMIEVFVFVSDLVSSPTALSTYTAIRSRFPHGGNQVCEQMFVNVY